MPINQLNHILYLHASIFAEKCIHMIRGLGTTEPGREKKKVAYCFSMFEARVVKLLLLRCFIVIYIYTHTRYYNLLKSGFESQEFYFH